LAKLEVINLHLISAKKSQRYIIFHRTLTTP